MFIAHFNYNSVQHLLCYVRMNLGYLSVYIRSGLLYVLFSRSFKTVTALCQFAGV
jgi:hypothetical protein